MCLLLRKYLYCQLSLCLSWTINYLSVGTNIVNWPMGLTNPVCVSRVDNQTHYIWRCEVFGRILVGQIVINYIPFVLAGYLTRCTIIDVVLRRWCHELSAIINWFWLCMLYNSCLKYEILCAVVI